MELSAKDLKDLKDVDKALLNFAVDLFRNKLDKARFWVGVCCLIATIPMFLVGNLVAVADLFQPAMAKDARFLMKAFALGGLGLVSPEVLRSLKSTFKGN